MILRLLLAAGLLLLPGSAWARRIVLSNDDGLTSNVKALYEALKADGHDVIASGTVGNVQFAGSRGLPAIAFSAGLKTTGDDTLANPDSAIVARLAVQLVKALDTRARGKAMLPPGLALNVNFPDRLAGAHWRLSRIGTYSSFTARFSKDVAKAAAPRPGVKVEPNTKPPTQTQKGDESVVYRKDIAVSVMQIGYDPQPAARLWARRHLRGFLQR